MAAHATPSRRFPRWMAVTLWLAAGYNLLWGAWVVLLPNQFFDLVGMDRPTHVSIWQCVGMIVGVYGLGYAIAATNPLRHWPIVLVGFLGKVFGPIGYVDGALVRGTLDPAFGWTIPTNDLVWWVPFAVILYAAFKSRGGELSLEAGPVEPLGEQQTRDLLERTTTDAGESVEAMSRRGPVALLMVRHFGCNLCREALADLAERREELEQRGVTPVVVHMSDAERGRAFLDRMGLAGVAQVSDPQREVYRGLGMGRGSFGQLFGPRTLAAGWRAKRYGVGKLEGDGFQLAGVAVVRDGRVVARRAEDFAGQRLDVCDVATPEPVTESEARGIAAAVATA